VEVGQGRHIVVDGMNVVGTRPDGWWKDREGAMHRLAARLVPLAREGHDVTLVLDGRPLPDLPEGLHDGVRVLYARRGGRNAADDRIIELVQDDADPQALVIVTSDRDLVRRVSTLGATTQGAGAFTDRLDQLERA
jgi:predicted RNA-binding protein with PIN domain